MVALTGGSPAGVLEIRAQAFQNAACNWRCWYCFVDFELLAANPARAVWLTAEELVDLYVAEPDPPPMIDLTGGQPDLVPEWVPWMMRALRERGLDKLVYLWSDDNLSNDYFWRFLGDDDRELVASYPLYGRVGCFKGFDAASFAFNTSADPQLFDRQFQLMARMLTLGIDQYAYATFTTADVGNVRDAMSRFVDRLQELDEHLPLRTVPLEIQIYAPVRERIAATSDEKRSAVENQWRAIDCWRLELERRFPSGARSLAITDIPIRGRTRPHLHTGSGPAVEVGTGRS